MRVRITIAAKDAVLAGVDDHGVKIVEVDPGELTEAEREVLACHPTRNQAAREAAEFELGAKTSPPQPYQYGNDIQVPYTWLAATPEAVHEWLQLAIVARQQRIGEKEAEQAAEEAKYATIRDELLAGAPESLLEKSYTSWRLVSHSRIEDDPRFVGPLEAAATIRDDRNAEIRAEEKAEKAAKEAVEAEKSCWISEHGSERLQRSAREEIEHNAVYLDERLAMERPGWLWYQDIECICDVPRNPPLEAFAVLDLARQVDEQAELAWGHVDWDDDDEDEYDKDPDRDQYRWSGYCALAEFLGREIVLFGEDSPE